MRNYYTKEWESGVFREVEGTDPQAPRRSSKAGRLLNCIEVDARSQCPLQVLLVSRLRVVNLHPSLKMFLTNRNVPC